MSGTPASSGIKSRPAQAAQTEAVLSQVQSLPTLPAIAIQLIEKTADSASSARDIVRLVESDQAIASRLLSLTRRANVGASVSTVDRAVVLLGFDAVRALVLSMQVLEVFADVGGRASRPPGGKDTRPPGRLDLAGLWKHSLAVGCAARLLAQESLSAVAAPARDRGAAIKPEEAFLCGLLHDIGKAALYVCFPKSYERVVQAVECNHGDISEQEREVFGIDHSIAGRRLALHWKLPPMIGECCWLHHQRPDTTPGRIAFAPYVHLVQLADRVTRQMHIGYSGNYRVEPVVDAARAAGVAQESLERVIARLPELVEERAELIGLNRVSSRELYQGAVLQANAELGRISSRLADQERHLRKRSACLEALALVAAHTGEQGEHRQVISAAAEGLSRLYPGIPVAVWAAVRGAGVSILCAGGPGGLLVQIDPLGGGAEDVRVAGPASGWASSDVLPGPLRDRFRKVMGGAPAWCWPVREDHGCEAALVLGGDRQIEPDPDTGIDLLAAALGQRLAIAGRMLESQQLQEELADINQRLTSAQAQVARMRSLMMIGEMAAGAAHELNNPLAVISGRAQLLNREGLSDEVRKNAAIISDHAARASNIVTELMEFAKPRPPQPIDLNLLGLLERLRQEWLARGVLGPEQFSIRVSDELPAVRGDEAQIRILFDELIRNAIEALTGRSDPRVVVNCTRYPADDRVVISVTDNGRGMPSEVLERAATPFYSSREAGRGRGLGLSKAVRYAEINGGTLRLSSEPGVGTEAIVELPVAG